MGIPHCRNRQTLGFPDLLDLSLSNIGIIGSRKRNNVTRGRNHQQKKRTKESLKQLTLSESIQGSDPFPLTPGNSWWCFPSLIDAFGASSSLMVSGAVLDTAVLFGKCIFLCCREILKNPHGSESSVTPGWGCHHLMEKEAEANKTVQKNPFPQGAPRGKTPGSASPHHSASLLESDSSIWLSVEPDKCLSKQI